MDFIDTELLGELTRWLSKSGELFFEKELRKSIPSWSNTQKVSLYEFLRDNGERYESEWRSQFVELLGIPDELLPVRKEAEEEKWGAIIFDLIDKGDLGKLKLFIENTGQLSQLFDPDEAYVDGKSINVETAEIVPFEFYPLQAANDESDYPEAYAREKGKVEMADFIKVSIGALSSRWSEAYEEGFQREMKRRRTFRIHVHNDLSLTHSGGIRTLKELVETALVENANFLVMQIKRQSKASSVEVWGPIMAAFHAAGIQDFENEWMD